MIGIGFGKEFDTKIIDSKAESGATVGMTPKSTRGLRDRAVTERRQTGLELIVREDGGLFETVHTLADFDVEDVTFGIEILLVGQVVFSDDLGCEITAVDPHLLVDKHVGDQKEIFQVASAIAGTETDIGDDAVDMELCVGEACRRRENRHPDKHHGGHRRQSCGCHKVRPCRAA